MQTKQLVAYAVGALMIGGSIVTASAALPNGENVSVVDATPLDAEPEPATATMSDYEHDEYEEHDDYDEDHEDEYEEYDDEEYGDD